jgi:hypothetical protein
VTVLTLLRSDVGERRSGKENIPNAYGSDYGIFNVSDSNIFITRKIQILYRVSMATEAF